MDLCAFLWNEYKKFKNNYIEHESEIKRCLFVVADALIKLVRESEDFEKDFLIQINNSVDDANVELQKVSEYLEENFGKLDDNSQIFLNILLTILEQIQKMNMQHYVTKSSIDETKKFQNNKKQKYIENWNSRLFLHQDNEENPITLADAFIMPDYVYYYTNKVEKLKGDTFEQTLECFLAQRKTLTMLITGVPGIGKTSIISWFANKYKEDDRVIILRFRDWDEDELKYGLIKAICNRLECNRRDINEKVLVLEGFDEIKCIDKRNHILYEFFNDIKDLEKSKIIITSRLSYIEKIYFNNVMILSPFSIEKIKEFYENISGIVLNETDMDTDNVDVLGVPVILYMAIMSNIDITRSATKPELYNRIFAEKGGIFDKFCEYDSGAQIMRNPDNIVCYLEFLGEIAFKMFEKNELVLLKNECKIRKLLFHGKSVSILEFPIKHLFENTSANIEFIHKTIYEYFTAEYIYGSIVTVLNDACEKTIKLAGVLGNLLKSHRLSPEILEFLKYKVENNLNGGFDIINRTFQLMMRDGMTYHTRKCYKNIIQIEINVFANMLEIIHLWYFIKWKPDKLLVNYIRVSRTDKLNLLKTNLYNENSPVLDEPKVSNLSGVDLRKVDLRYANLIGFDFTMANLSGADLRGAELNSATLVRADLTNAKLVGAKFYNANLMNADLRGATINPEDLKGANLVGVIFDEIQIHQLSKENNLQETWVYIDKTKSIVGYENFQYRGS